MELIKVSCPCCEGSVTIDAKQNEARCNYCDTVFLINNAIKDSSVVENLKDNSTIADNKDTKKDSNEHNIFLKKALNYMAYGRELMDRIDKLYDCDEVFRGSDKSAFSTYIELPFSRGDKLCYGRSQFFYHHSMYNGVDVDRKKLAPNYYQEEYDKWLQENQDLYTKLLEIEKELRTYETNPITLKKNNHKKITSNKEDIAFMTEKNNNDYDEETITNLEKELGVRIDDLKFSRVELLLFSKKNDEVSKLRYKFQILKDTHTRGKKIKSRLDAYNALSDEDKKFLLSWLDLRDLVLKYTNSVVDYTRCVDNGIARDDFSYDLLAKLEKTMDSVQDELETSNLIGQMEDEINKRKGNVKVA